MTATGKMFYEYASHIIRLTEESVSAVRDKNVARGNLNIGSLEATALSDLPGLFASYHKSYPDVILSLTTDMNDVFLKKVLDRTLDGAFISDPGTHPDLDQIYIKKEELILVGGNGQQDIESLDILETAQLITFPQGSIFRQRFELLLYSFNISYGSRLTILNSLAAMIVNIVSGLGCGYLPRSIAGPYIRQGIMKEYPIVFPHSDLDIVFIYRKDHLRNAAFRFF